MAINEYITRYILLSKIHLNNINNDDEKSVKLGNKAIDEMDEIAKILNETKGGIEAFATLLDSEEKEVKYYAAMQILNDMNPDVHIQEKCLSLVREKIEKENSFAYKLWLKDWEENKRNKK